MLAQHISTSFKKCTPPVWLGWKGENIAPSNTAQIYLLFASHSLKTWAPIGFWFTAPARLTWQRSKCFGKTKLRTDTGRCCLDSSWYPEHDGFIPSLHYITVENLSLKNASLALSLQVNLIMGLEEWEKEMPAFDQWRIMVDNNIMICCWVLLLIWSN